MQCPPRPSDIFVQARGFNDNGCEMVRHDAECEFPVSMIVRSRFVRSRCNDTSVHLPVTAAYARLRSNFHQSERVSVRSNLGDMCQAALCDQYCKVYEEQEDTFYRLFFSEIVTSHVSQSGYQVLARWPLYHRSLFFQGPQVR